MQIGSISKIPGIFTWQEKCFLPNCSHRLLSQPSETEYRLSIIMCYAQMCSTFMNIL